MKLFLSIVTLVFILSIQSLKSQVNPQDSLFQEARKQAFSNNYADARIKCYEILKMSPEYRDVRILLARTYAWEQKFDSARNHLKVVLLQDPYSLDAYLALADVETWSQNCAEAMNLCNSALAKIPNNYELFIKKIKACLCLEDVACARAGIDSLLKVYPLNREVQDLINQINNGKFKNRLIVEHSFEFFRKPYVRRWHVTSFQYQRDFRAGTFIAKTNVGQLIQGSGKLFDPGAVQYEADFYPILGRGFYGYMNYGYSDGDLFPTHQAGLELFKTLPKGFEVSLGGRYLYFSKSDVEVFVYTSSVSKYSKSWYFSLRQYLSEINDEWNYSLFAFARKYSNQYNYIGGMLGYGVSPDFNPATSGDYELYNQNSYQARFDIQHRLSTHFLLRSLTGYSYDQYSSKEYRHRFNAQLYLAYMF